MRVLVAPDKFRSTLTAPEAAAAIAAGWRRSRPGDALDEVPMADGGEGTLDALLDALGGERRAVTVSGPLGEPVDAAFGLALRGGERLAVVETAMACGQELVAPERRDPLHASTFGVGELLLAAASERVDEVLVGVGGSATTDGGAGMAQALGVRLLDATGGYIPRGGRGLLDLAGIDLRGLDRSIASTRVVVAADVDNPLVGVHGAASVYAPQKGASPEDVRALGGALEHLAATIVRDVGVDVGDLPGGGAAGGLGAGLVAFVGAHLRRGAEVAMDAVGLDRRLADTDLVVTGEGRFDEQSLRGKVAGSVIEHARRARTPVVVLCGQATVTAAGVDVRSLESAYGLEVATHRARAALEDLATEVASGRALGDGPVSSPR